MKKLSSILVKIIVFLFRITPFFILYILSDILRLFIQYVFSYRKDIIHKHIDIAFPKSSDKERKRIIKGFYKNLCDTIVETLKGFSLSKKQILKRNRVLNPEILDKHFDNNQNILALTAHYANWEWSLISLDLQLKHQSSATYMPLTNPVLNIYMKNKREKFGMQLIPVQKTREYFDKDHSKAFSCLFGADQNPANVEKAIWLDFLNRDTPWAHGPATLSKKYNLPIYYYNIQRVKRGYYTLEIIQLIDSPHNYSNSEIIEAYKNKIEEVIANKPEDYLWSHKRWKHKR